MSGNRWKVTSGELDSNISNPRTLIYLYPWQGTYGVPILVEEISVSFKGTSISGTPVLVTIARQTGDPTSSPMMNALSVLPDPDDTNSSLVLTAYYANAYSMGSEEPSTGSVLFSTYVHPQRGFTWRASPGNEIKVQAGSSQGLGVIVTADASFKCMCRIVGTE